MSLEHWNLMKSGIELTQNYRVGWLDTLKMLWSSVVKLAKKINSSSLAKVTSHLPWHWSLINQPLKQVWILEFTVHLWSAKCQNHVLYKYQPSSGQSSSLLMKTSCLRLKLVELNFFASFITDNQNIFNVSCTSKLSTWPFSNYWVIRAHKEGEGNPIVIRYCEWGWTTRGSLLGGVWGHHSVWLLEVRLGLLWTTYWVVPGVPLSLAVRQFLWGLLVK